MIKAMPFSALHGLTLISISGCEKGDDYIEFVSTTGRRFQLLHYQDCCENVYIADVVGDVQDLIGSPITLAEESSNEPTPAGFQKSSESSTWTFYKLATIKGYVDIRWLGESNGYYSESVDFAEIVAK